jgi:hypothetical protein
MRNFAVKKGFFSHFYFRDDTALPNPQNQVERIHLGKVSKHSCARSRSFSFSASFLICSSATFSRHRAISSARACISLICCGFVSISSFKGIVCCAKTCCTNMVRFNNTLPKQKIKIKKSTPFFTFYTIFTTSTNKKKISTTGGSASASSRVASLPVRAESPATHTCA